MNAIYGRRSGIGGAWLVLLRWLFADGAVFFQPAEQFFLKEILDHRLTETVGIDVTLTGELGCDLLHFCVNLWVFNLEAFCFR